jgi:hypothetical protein
MIADEPMGKIRCEQHGMQGVALTCPHVYLAWRADEPIAFAEIPQGFWRSAPVCPACVPASPGELSQDELEAWLVSIDLKPICSPCFDAWQRRVAPQT